MILYVLGHFIKTVLYDIKEIITYIWKTRKLSYSLKKTKHYFLSDFYEQNVVLSPALVK